MSSPDIADCLRPGWPSIEAKKGEGISRPCLFFAVVEARPLSWFVDNAGDDVIADSLSAVTWGELEGKGRR